MSRDSTLVRRAHRRSRYPIVVGTIGIAICAGVVAQNALTSAPTPATGTPAPGLVSRMEPTEAAAQRLPANAGDAVVAPVKRVRPQQSGGTAAKTTRKGAKAEQSVAQTCPAGQIFVRKSKRCEPRSAKQAAARP